METISIFKNTEKLEDSVVSPEELGLMFNQLDSADFMNYQRQLIKQDNSIRLAIIADWVDVNKTRAAKALIDDARWHIDSIIIKATRQQFEEDVNTFQSGVQWQEVL